MLKELLPDIDKHYSKETREIFLKKYEDAGLLVPITVPLLLSSNKLNVIKNINSNFAEIDFTKIHKLLIFNNNSHDIKILASTNFFEIDNLEELFNKFISVTNHANRFQHFRDYPEYYARVLQDSRYFYFHGDGFCTQLALLFQAMARKVLNLDVTAMYCRTEDFKFSHGYCLYNNKNDCTYIDPDLKAFFPYSDFKKFKPASWFINFIENIAIYKYHKLQPDQQNEMFYDFACKYFEWLGTCCDRELSLPNSDYNITLNLLHTTLPNNNEVFDIFADDYPWKSTYRNEAYKYGATRNLVMMQNLDKPFTITLPANSTLEVNPKDQLSDYSTELSKYYFGRVAGVLRINLVANENITITLPEIPWYVAITKGNASQITFNGHDIKFSEDYMLSGVYYRGMGALNHIVKTFWTNGELTLKSQFNCELSIYFPINASFWNSDLIKLELEDYNGVQLESYSSL
jgi:hypothetical protein